MAHIKTKICRKSAAGLCSNFRTYGKIPTDNACYDEKLAVKARLFLMNIPNSLPMAQGPKICPARPRHEGGALDSTKLAALLAAALEEVYVHCLILTILRMQSAAQ